MSEQPSVGSVTFWSYQICKQFGRYEEFYDRSIKSGLSPEKAQQAAARVAMNSPYLGDSFSPDVFRQIHESPEARVAAHRVCLIPDEAIMRQVTDTWSRDTVSQWDGSIRRPPGALIGDQIDFLRNNPFSVFFLGIANLVHPDNPSAGPKERHDNQEKQLEFSKQMAAFVGILKGARDITTRRSVNPPPDDAPPAMTAPPGDRTPVPPRSKQPAGAGKGAVSPEPGDLSYVLDDALQKPSAVESGDLSGVLDGAVENPFSAEACASAAEVAPESGHEFLASGYGTDRDGSAYETNAYERDTSGADAAHAVGYESESGSGEEAEGPPLPPAGQA
ncbi:hypothetical protein ABT112_23545 [Streptomyces sp. NPDC002055]|uniref:hypothetical protein n=1 Tax=Streptomyces sp. NPDC002055 TaxID=3154534 RepID=UPI00332C2412